MYWIFFESSLFPDIIIIIIIQELWPTLFGEFFALQFLVTIRLTYCLYTDTEYMFDNINPAEIVFRLQYK